MLPNRRTHSCPKLVLARKVNAFPWLARTRFASTGYVWCTPNSGARHTRIRCRQQFFTPTGPMGSRVQAQGNAMRVLRPHIVTPACTCCRLSRALLFDRLDSSPAPYPVDLLSKSWIDGHLNKVDLLCHLGGLQCADFGTYRRRCRLSVS